jgi:hypothetical protein
MLFERGVHATGSGMEFRCAMFGIEVFCLAQERAQTEVSARCKK